MPRLLIALPFLSSLLYILAFPNANLSLLAWIALVPLAVVAQRTSPRQAFLWGWLSGTLAYGGILYWVVVTFAAAHLSMGLAFLCLLLLAGYLGLYWAVWAWFLAKQIVPGTIFVDKKWYLVPFLGAAGWVALEYLRTYLFSGFPWALLADSQVRNLPLIQIASITGVYGISFLVVLVNLAIASFRPRMIVTTALVCVGVFGGGWVRLHRSISIRHRPPIRIALLQGNVDQYKKWDNAYVEDIERSYESLVAQAVLSKPRIILWPETSVPGYLLQDPPLRNWLQKVVKNSHVHHLIGAPVIHSEKAYNASFSINPEGVIGGEYAKVHLVPFGEVVPWANVLGRYIKVLNELGGFTSGTRSPVILIAGVSVGVNICYEAIFPNLVRQSVQQGADFIANLTNDGWYMKTSAPYQHWAPNIFRAVENDRWVVRADNTGISGIIDAYGRVQAASAIFEPAVVDGTIEARRNMTFYTKFGDIFAWLCCALCLFLVIKPLLIYSRRETRSSN